MLLVAHSGDETKLLYLIKNNFVHCLSSIKKNISKNAVFDFFYERPMHNKRSVSKRATRLGILISAYEAFYQSFTIIRYSYFQPMRICAEEVHYTMSP